MLRRPHYIALGLVGLLTLIALNLPSHTAGQIKLALRENEQLRQLLGWSRQMPWNLKLANVVQRDPANWWQTVFIDAGSRDGMRVDLPVMTSAGLVGRISAVYPT